MNYNKILSDKEIEHLKPEFDEICEKIRNSLEDKDLHPIQISFFLILLKSHIEVLWNGFNKFSGLDGEAIKKLKDACSRLTEDLESDVEKRMQQ